MTSIRCLTSVGFIDQTQCVGQQTGLLQRLILAGCKHLHMHGYMHTAMHIPTHTHTHRDSVCVFAQHSCHAFFLYISFVFCRFLFHINFRFTIFKCSFMFKPTYSAGNQVVISPTVYSSILQTHWTCILESNVKSSSHRWHLCMFYNWFKDFTDLLCPKTTQQWCRFNISWFGALEPQVGTFWLSQSQGFNLRVTLHLWNHLPAEIKLAESVTCFKSLLEKHFYIKMCSKIIFIAMLHFFFSLL